MKTVIARDNCPPHCTPAARPARREDESRPGAMAKPRGQRGRSRMDDDGSGSPALRMSR
jgi:hypothetical protein